MKTESGGDRIGRYVYHVKSLPGQMDGNPTYEVNRLSDGRYLGVVQRESGKSWWFSRMTDGSWTTRGVRTRDEAADFLDGKSLLNEWCSCGIAIGNHDRATRAACHVWAIQPDEPPNRPKMAWLAAYQRRPRGRHFDVDKAMMHAVLFGSPPDYGTTRLVSTIGGQIVRVDLHLSQQTGQPVADTWVMSTHTDELTFTGTFGDPADQLQQAIDRHLHDGWQPVYDWRR